MTRLILLYPQTPSAMARSNAVMAAMIAKWQDGTVDYGFDAEDPDTTVYILAKKTDNYHIRRTEDEEEPQELEQCSYEVYRPDELTVDKYQSMQDNGWSFVDVTVRDLSEWFHSFWNPD